MRHGFWALSSVLLMGAAAGVQAATLATREQGMTWRDKLQDLIADKGIDTAIETLRAQDSRFVAADPAMIIHRVTDTDAVIAAAHTVYPSLNGLALTDQTDLAGRNFIQSFLAAARAGGGERPTTNVIPQTGKVHEATCYNEWADGYKGAYFITVCYDRPTDR